MGEVSDPALRLTITLNWILTAILMLQFWTYRAPLTVEVNQTSERKRVRKDSLMYCVSHIGSSRCLTDLVGDQLERSINMSKVQSLTALSSMTERSGFASFPSLRRSGSF